MSTNYITPDSESVQKLLEILFGEDLTVADHASSDLNDTHIATFIDNEDKLVAVCACDKKFVAYTGAALSMVPVAVADEVLSSGEMTDAVIDNFHEVMNICSKLMMSESSAHLRLAKTLLPEQSSEAISALESAATQLCFDVDIPNYGNGKIHFMIT